MNLKLAAYVPFSRGPRFAVRDQALTINRLLLGPPHNRAMTDLPTSQACCPKCRNIMTYVTSIPFRSMLRTTFVCYTCRQTRNYVLSPAMAQAYAPGGTPPD